MIRLAACVAAVVLTVGCSGGSGSSGTPTAAASVPPSTSASPGTTAVAGVDRAITVAVNGRRVLPTPSRVRIRVGERVGITVISDVDNQLHVHGVDVERDVPADRPVTIAVAYDQPGVYEVELHHPPLLLFQLVVR